MKRSPDNKLYAFQRFAFQNLKLYFQPRFFNRRKIETTESLQCFRVVAFARSALQTNPIPDLSV